MSVRAARPAVTWRELGALFLLPFGGLGLPVVGWFLGVILLWSSDAWTQRDKLVGTLVIPGGLLAPSVLFSVALATTSPGSTLAWRIVLISVLLVAPLAADGYLVWRLRRGAGAY